MANPPKKRPKQQLVSPTGRDIVMPAIESNLGVEQWYRRQLEAMVDTMNASVQHWLPAAWKEADPSIGFMAQDANAVKVLQRAINKLTAQWTRNFGKLAVDLATRFANQSVRHTNFSMMASLKKVGFAVEFRPTTGSLEAYSAIVAENVQLIKSIPAEYLKDVQTAVWQSVTTGHDLGTLTARLEHNYGITHRRAAFIARDQNNKARAVMENTRRQELGIEEAIWKHSGGGKVPRPTHVHAGSIKLRYSLAKGAYLDGKWVWPGSEPNCKCTSRGVIPGVVYEPVATASAA
jgi:uncharacterized protein with gpF-like domain